MASSFPYAAILFDCDGVLVDSEVVGLKEGVAFLNAHGFSLTVEDAVRRFTGMRTDRLRAAFMADYELVLDRSPSDEEVDDLLEGFIACRRVRRHLMKTVPGALDTVAWTARLGGVGVAVASSSGMPQLSKKVTEFGFAPHFGKHVYSGDDVAEGKPAPDIFLYAAERLGVAPEAGLGIEDSPNGGKAGCAAGATVWGFTGAGHCLPNHAERLEEVGAEAILSDHSTLRSAIAALSASG